MEPYLQKHRSATILTPVYFSMAPEKDLARYAAARERDVSYDFIAHRGFCIDLDLPANTSNEPEARVDALQSMRASGVYAIDLIADSAEYKEFVDIATRWNNRKTKPNNERSIRITPVIDYDVTESSIMLRDSTNGFQAFSRTARFNMDEKYFADRYKPLARVAPQVKNMNYVQAPSLLEALEMGNTIYRRLRVLKEVRPVNTK